MHHLLCFRPESASHHMQCCQGGSIALPYGFRLDQFIVAFLENLFTAIIDVSLSPREIVLLNVVLLYVHDNVIIDINLVLRGLLMAMLISEMLLMPKY